MNADLLRFNQKQKYLVIDTETEGLNLVSSRPWQVSWLVCQGDKILEEHDIYVKWQNLKVSKGAAKITGFTTEEYERKAENNKDAWEKVASYLYDPQYKIVGQNLLGFDVYVLNTWRKLRKMKSDYSFVDRIIDTRSLGVSISRNIPLNKDNFLSWQYKMLEIKTKRGENSMATLLKKYNIPHDPKKLHDALYDINMNYKVFRKQLYEVEL